MAKPTTSFWNGAYRKLVPTLALINHLADAGHGPIDKDAMMRALGLAGAGPEAETAAALELRRRDWNRPGYGNNSIQEVASRVV
jgi:hypothetical protein